MPKKTVEVEKTHDELEMERLKKMRAKSNGTAANRIPCIVHNIEAPGEQIEGCVGGITFIIQDGEHVLLSKAQIECLRNAKIDTFVDDTDPDNPTGERAQHRHIVIPRFSVEVQTEGIEDMLKKLSAGQKAADPDKAPAGDGAMISGRTD